MAVGLRLSLTVEGPGRLNPGLRIKRFHCCCYLTRCGICWMRLRNLLDHRQQANLPQEVPFNWFLKRDFHGARVALGR